MKEDEFRMENIQDSYLKGTSDTRNKPVESRVLTPNFGKNRVTGFEEWYTCCFFLFFIS